MAHLLNYKPHLLNFIYQHIAIGSKKAPGIVDVAFEVVVLLWYENPYFIKSDHLLKRISHSIHFIHLYRSEAVLIKLNKWKLELKSKSVLVISLMPLFNSTVSSYDYLWNRECHINHRFLDIIFSSSKYKNHLYKRQWHGIVQLYHGDGHTTC